MTEGDVRIEVHAGDRERLRPLFELAEDSPTELAAYFSAGTVLVAMDGDDVVGHLQLVDTAVAGRAEIKNMAVLEAAQRRGIGARLVRAAAERATAAGATELVVATGGADVGNLAFYQRQGFRLLSVERDAFTPAQGYPPGITIDGIPLRDRVWLDRSLRREAPGAARAPARMAPVSADATTTTVPTRADIAAAADLIAPHVRRTPVVDVMLPGGRPGTLKLELLQHTGSFKPRGAFASVLAAPQRPHVLVAASGGNHGLAVAHVGRTLGIPTQIFVPETAPRAKVTRLRALGAEVTQAGQVYADALVASAAAAATPGALTLHAYDAPGTVTGQGTLGLELEQQCAPTTVLVAVGGGGLIGGIGAWFAGSGTRVVGVEPEGCDALAAALEAGRPVATAPTGVAVDSLGASTIGSICFEVARATGMTAVRVPDDAIREARTWLWRELRLTAEPGGATALAALLSGAWRPADGERVAVVVCGANADPSDLPLD